MFGRRHSRWGHLLLRLSLIVIWAIIVILVLFKSIKSTNPYGSDGLSSGRELPASQRALRWAMRDTQDQPRSPSEASGRRLTDSTTMAVNHHRSSSPTNSDQSNYEEPGVSDDNALMTKKSAVEQTSDIHIDLMTTTRRSPASDYMRRGEIFILIIREEDFISNTHTRVNNFVNDINGSLYPQTDGMYRFGHIPVESKYLHKFTTPDHIRHLIEVLKYHRISYTLDVMRTGLPSELLQNPRRYPVIIIDDFIKYDRLNRWARDQLDRHCRNHRTGVISYLINKSGSTREVVQSNAHDNDSRIQQESSASKRIKMNGHLKTEAAKEYPLMFEPVTLDDCSNQSSTNCYIDYKLNDKASLLRIVKREPNFVLSGDLRTVLNANSLVAMTSNHVTHEPLTWSWLRRPTTVMDHLTGRRRQRTASEKSTASPSPASVSRAGTRAANHRGQSAREVDRGVNKRSVLPSPTLATPFYDTDLVDDAVNASDYDENHGVALDDGDAAQRSMSNEYSVDDEGQKHGNEATSDTVDQLHSADSQASWPEISRRGDRRVIAMLDNGLYDDIKRVIFGVSNHQWLNRLLLLDAIEHLSFGEILTPLERYIQIDVDDIFVGATGTRMNKSDVEALIETQDYFANLVEGGFKFNLGFSGKYFGRGTEAEQLGDRQLIVNSDKFSWFCHFWSHSKAHLFSSTESLIAELRRNLEFARDNNLTLIGHHNRKAELENTLDRGGAGSLPPTYAVAPHHSGVYPIHAELYEAWRTVLNVQTTTTEEYPHLRPANQRRGFVHGTIKVLPRQTCGLYTHTIYKNKYPGGYRKLLASIRGGELFETIVHNPVNIYMTHMSNYANDRLAPSTFKALFEFVNSYTNLRLKFANPHRKGQDTVSTTTTTTTTTTVAGSGNGGPFFLADYYFSLYPEEREPIWTNPCDDKRHLAIWSTRKLKFCQVVPKLLIVGPQKTGTTALQSFLQLNPSIRTSRPSSEDFEEVQFFNDKHYSKGSDWYFERFLQDDDDGNNGSPSSDSANMIHLDKSATYFDDPKVPSRAGALIPEAHILILLINPSDRAYSWYQHMRAHNDPTASEFTFDEVIMFQDTPAVDESLQMTGSSLSLLAKLNYSYPSSSSSSHSRLLTESQRSAVKALRSRCLHPGYYSNHLLKWLDHYPSRQIVIIDGEWFRLNPKAVLNRLQLLLRLPQQADYDKLLVYYQPKGFYCELQERRRKVTGSPSRHQSQPSIRCLGGGKGRKYGPMSTAARNYLDEHYLSHNRQLARLLYEIGQPLPRWLDRAINPLPTS